MGVCDSNGSSPYSEVKNNSSSSRKGSLGNMTFVGLSGNPDDELNLNAKDFIENTAITFLPSVDADNQPDPLPMKKPAEPRSSLPQQQSLHTSNNKNDDVLPPSHENDVERGMTEFDKVMDLIIKREEGAATHSSRHNSGSSFGQLSDMRSLQKSSSNDDLANGTGSSPPPYPGTGHLSGAALKRAAQQLATTKDKYLQQQMATHVNHTPNSNGTQSQPTPTPMTPAVTATAETNWQQQQLMVAKQQQQQQQMMAMQQQQQNKIRAKVQQQQPTQQQQFDIFKSASPNVTIVSRDPYRSTTMTVQQQSPNVVVHPSSMAAMNHQVHMMQANTQPVQTMGQPSLMHQQQPVTISMSRNQPQVYAPMPSAGPYVGAAVDPMTVNRSNSIAFSGIENQQHLYQQQQRRHSLPPHIPSAVHQVHWQQQQDLLLDGSYNSVVADVQHAYSSMAGQKRCQSYLPPQVAVAKRNSFHQHMPVSHAMVQASYQQQPHSNTMMNGGDIGQPMYNNSMVDPLMSFDRGAEMFGAPL